MLFPMYENTNNIYELESAATHRCTIVYNFHFIQFNILGMPP